MTITSTHFSKFLWPGVYDHYGMKYKEKPLQLFDIFEKKTSKLAFEEIVGAVGWGIAPVKTAGSAVTFEDASQGFIDRFTHVTYALGFIVTEETYEDGLGVVESLRKAESLAFSIRQTQEIVGANVLNRAFNSSYTFGDGVELCSTAHPNYSGGTWANELTTAADLSETSLEQALIDIRGFDDDKGLKISVLPKKLVVPPALMFEAKRILMSDLQNDTANNAINAVKGILPGGFIVNDYLTDDDAWFVLTDAPNGMLYFERKGMMFKNESDFDTGNMKAKASIRFSVGCADKRGIFGSPGAA